MTRTERERLEDLRDAIGAIGLHLADQNRISESLEDLVLRDAILYRLVVIGEAVKGLSEETRAASPEIPWRRIAGMRDQLAHEYFRLRTDTIAETVERDLPPLEEAVDRLLAE